MNECTTIHSQQVSVSTSQLINISDITRRLLFGYRYCVSVLCLKICSLHTAVLFEYVHDDGVAES